MFLYFSSAEDCCQLFSYACQPGVGSCRAILCCPDSTVFRRHFVTGSQDLLGFLSDFDFASVVRYLQFSGHRAFSSSCPGMEVLFAPLFQFPVAVTPPSSPTSILRIMGFAIFSQMPEAFVFIVEMGQSDGGRASCFSFNSCSSPFFFLCCCQNLYQGPDEVTDEVCEWM